MKFKIPPEWIKGWITKGGRRIPVIKKEFRKNVLWLLSFAKKSPVRVVDPRTINKMLKGLEFDTFPFLDYPAAPPPKVRKEVLTQLNSFLDFIKGTSYEQSFQRVSISFHRLNPSRGTPLGFYIDANILGSSNVIERALSKDFFGSFSSVDRAKIRSCLGIDIPKFYGTESIVKDLAKEAFPQGSGAISIQVYPMTHRVAEYGHTLLHEVGHFVQSQFSVAYPWTYTTFGSKAYAPYISRVLPESTYFFDEAVKIYGRSRPGVNRNYVRLRFYRKLMKDPLQTPVLTLPSLRDPEEGFSEAFAFYVNADPNVRRILKVKWPEAYSYFDWLKNLI